MEEDERVTYQNTAIPNPRLSVSPTTQGNVMKDKEIFNMTYEFYGLVGCLSSRSDDYTSGYGCRSEIAIIDRNGKNAAYSCTSPKVTSHLWTTMWHDKGLTQGDGKSSTLKAYLF